MLEQLWKWVHRTATAVSALTVVRTLPACQLELPSRRRAEPAPLSVAERWARATGVVTSAIAGVGRLESLQAAAVSQIDATDYSLQRLLDELSTAMPILPADGSALRALLATVTERESEEEARTLAA